MKSRLVITLATLAICLFTLEGTFAQGKGKGKKDGGGGDDGGGDTTPLPAIRYQLHLDILPDVPNIYSGLNELGEYVGYLTDYAANGIRRPFLYDSLSGQITFINESLDPSVLPSGWRFAAALDINDYGVVVGYAIDEWGAYHACAVDLGQASPGLDILPTVSGVESTALKINNAGLILAAENGGQPNSAGGWDLCWTLDTGLYGPQASRVPRTSPSMDLRSATPAIVPVVCKALESDLSELSASGLTWVGGLEASDVGDAPFRYPVGAANADFYSELAYQSGNYGGINDAGNFAGSASVVIGKKGKNDVYSRIAYRYDASVSDYTTITDDYVYTSDINNINEVLMSVGPLAVFRAWGDGQGERLLPLDDKLVLGTADDLATWLSNGVRASTMNDAGIIVGSITDSATGTPYLYTLVPEVANP